MARKYTARWDPEWHTQIYDVVSKVGAEDQDSLNSARKIRQPILSKDDIDNAFDGITYQKGASVIGMFEGWMGPEEFRKGVQSYLKQYAFHAATARDFLDSLSTSSKAKHHGSVFHVSQSGRSASRFSGAPLQRRESGAATGAEPISAVGLERIRRSGLGNCPYASVTVAELAARANAC